MGIVQALIDDKQKSVNVLVYINHPQPHPYYSQSSMCMYMLYAPYICIISLSVYRGKRSGLLMQMDFYV